MTEASIEAAKTTEQVKAEGPAAPQVPPQVLLKLEADPTLVPARGSEQMFLLVPREVVLAELTLHGEPKEDGGFAAPPESVKVIRVGVGPRMFPANVGGMDVGRWEDCMGQVAPSQSYLVVALQNEGAEPVVVGGTWTVEIKRGAATAATPQQTSGVSGTASRTVREVQRPALPPSEAGAVPQATAVKAGANEVAVFLTREACRRLLESLMSGPAINPYEKGDIVRRLSTAMAQP